MTYIMMLAPLAATLCFGIGVLVLLLIFLWLVYNVIGLVWDMWQGAQAWIDIDEALSEWRANHPEKVKMRGSDLGM